MKLLKITDRELEGLDDYFEEVHQVEVDKIAPEVVDMEPRIKVGDKLIEEFDAVYAEIPVKNAVFGRVFLEMVEDFRIPVNYSSTGFFVMAKKNYLYYTLHEQELPAPKTVAIATEKASRNLEKNMKGPVIGRRFEDLKESENRKLETVDSIRDFSEGAEYEEDLLIFHEYESGPKFRCLVIGEKIIPIKDDSEGWRFSDDNLNYSNISDTQKEIVKSAVNKIGTPMAEILLRGETIYDIRPNPDLDMYTQVSGKNAYENVAELLKEEA